MGRRHFKPEQIIHMLKGPARGPFHFLAVERVLSGGRSPAACHASCIGDGR
jgi:hypothetical protein